MIRIALILALLPAFVAAEDWISVPGDDLRATLEGRKLIYSSGAWQDFRATGRTLYNAGRDSWGYWRVQGGQYCSMWPPSDLWACYEIETASGALRFVGASGDVTEATFAE